MVLEERRCGRKNPLAVCTLIRWMAFGPSNCVICEVRAVNCASNKDIGLTNQLARTHEIEFASVQSIDKEFSVENTKAIVMFQSDN